MLKRNVYSEVWGFKSTCSLGQACRSCSSSVLLLPSPLVTEALTPSGRFDLPVGLAVFVSLGSPVRRHAAYVCVGVLTQRLRSRSHLFIFASLVSLSRGDGVCRELGEACEAVWGGRDPQREPLSVMRCEPRTPRRAGERGSDCSLRTEASFASTLSVNLEVCPHCSSALKRLHHPPKMARVNS